MFEFFQVYDAVITDRAGAPQWCTASQDTLIRWAKSDIAEWRRSDANHARLVDRMSDIANELRRRQGLTRDAFSPEASVRLDTFCELFDLIGWHHLRAECQTIPANQKGAQQRG